MKYLCVSDKHWVYFKLGETYETNENGDLLNELGMPVKNALSVFYEDFELCNEVDQLKAVCVRFESHKEHLTILRVFRSLNVKDGRNFDGLAPPKSGWIAFNGSDLYTPCYSEIDKVISYQEFMSKFAHVLDGENMNLPDKRHEPSERVIEHFEREHAIEEARQNKVEIDPEEERIKRASDGLTLFVGDV